MGKNISKVIFLVFFLFFSFVAKASSKTLPQVIFINHVRGEECCDKGSLDNFELQLKTFSDLELPAFFSLRYDALTDPQYQKLIKKYYKNDLFQFGVMLEVTPQLATNSFVEYKDTPENWFQAQNAFLIGYEQNDRIALMDTLIESYENLFDHEPEFSTAWQVDTFSLNYLQKEHGLLMHQIAREQWGLDSYTLDGGPPHYPYLASNKWAFNPDFSDNENLLIVRHTIDDSLYTYGDNTSAFTSQPNDYSLDKKDFGYFEKLLDQVLNQTHQIGFANLGLENSMATQYQKEYIKQIEKINKFVKEGRVSVVDNIKSLKSIYQSDKITIHEGNDLISNSKNKSFWITTPKYRIRLRFAGERVLITDLRVYHPHLEDPYLDTQAVNKGYFITPYLINDGIDFPQIKTASKVQKFLKIPMINSFQAEPKKDVNSQNNYLQFPNVTDFDSIKIPAKNTITYLNNDRNITFNFNQDAFEIKEISNAEIDYSGKNFDLNPISFSKNNNGGELSWKSGKDKSLRTHWECKEMICHFEFELTPQLFPQMIETQYPFIFPEKKIRELDKDKTIIYAHNRYAIAGRNPVRIVLVPQDKNGFPTSTKEEVIVTTTPQAKHVRIENQTASREYQFVDVNHEKPEAIKLNLQLDDINLPTQTIFFAPNCKKEIKYCITHPKQSWWFIKTVFEDKVRLKLLGEKQS
ncbi:MAG: hypothetical protein OEX81_00355 [Candidatus Pacebacteria bacterium]|nr:hypothetical protein [Candidatus Paceibacterota bacterium]